VHPSVATSVLFEGFLVARALYRSRPILVAQARAVHVTALWGRLVLEAQDRDVLATTLRVR
jgi:hypothetical protein